MTIGSYHTDEFGISTSTPQGSPLSPILSALYTSPLLAITDNWTFSDLTMYIDDGAIFATSSTIRTATTTAMKGMEMVL
jgi:retron-type reverse transcriptase